MAAEIELKLDLAADGAGLLAASGLLGPCSLREQLVATYFDTDKDRLHRCGMTLRIRREGGHLIQAVKSRNGAAAGLFTRGEWEIPVRSATPVVDERTPLPEALGGHATDLAARFVLEVERANHVLSEGESQVKVALDVGRARAGDRTAAFAELELELVSGHARDLFAIARRLDAAAPLRIGALSKADRGFRLTGPLRRSEPAGDIRLDPAMGPVAACAAIVADCLHQYRINEAILLAERSVEALHQLRVALRRLRTVHAVFAPLLGDETSARLDRAVRNLARTCGRARDLDVLWARADAGQRGLLRQRREGAWHGVAGALGAATTRHLMLDLAEWSALGAWRDAAETAQLRAMPLMDFAAAALDRRLRRVRRHGRHFPELADEARHTLRKDSKKLRYAVEFFAALHGGEAVAKRRRAFLRALKALQERLGELNDLAVERALLGADAADDEDARAALLKEAGAARHALLEREPFW